MEHIKDVEDFFSAFQGSEIADRGDWNALSEMFQGVLSGFAIELCEMNDGEFFTLQISAHDAQAWNCDDEAHDEAFSALGREENTSLYRFESLAAAQEALATFLRVAL